MSFPSESAYTPATFPATIGLFSEKRSQCGCAEGTRIPPADGGEEVHMLVLSRKLGEKIFIGEDICITVVDISFGKIRLGIEAPREVPIYRQEVLPPVVLPEESPRKIGP